MDNAPERAGGLRQAMAAIYGFMSPRRRAHLWLALGLMILGALGEFLTIGAVLPFLALISDPSIVDRIPALKLVFDALGWEASRDFALLATVLLVGVAVSAALIRLLLTWVSQKFVFQLGHEIGIEIYSRLLRQPYSYYVSQHTSEAIAAIEKIQIAVLSVVLPLMQGCIAAVLALAICGILVSIDPSTALTAAASMAIIYVGVSIASRRALKRNSVIIAGMQARRVKQIQEGLGGIRDILLDHSQAVYERTFRKLDYTYRRAQAGNLFIHAAPRFIVESSGVALLALLAYHLSRQPGGLMAAVPVLGALALGAQRLLPLVQLIYNGWSQATGSAQVLDDVVDLMQMPIHETGRKQGVHKPFGRSVEFRDVTFRYKNGLDVLKQVNLTLPKGVRLGLIGETGSGKSTFLDLLMGLLVPHHGQIFVDDELLTYENLGDWQRHIAHVPQSIYLSDSSIASNIAFGQTEAEMDRDTIIDAAKRAQIHEFITTLPEGYETEAGERGVRLSGGQRQRIGIARALYKQAAILILDEATSALDNETEASVVQSISTTGSDLTIVMIAHRLSSLRGCDVIVRMDGGQIVDKGSFNEIIGPSLEGGQDRERKINARQ